LAILNDGSVEEVAHELKTWPDVYQQIESGTKTHEFRKNDRDFRNGDLVLLREFEPAGERYTGREILVRIGAISYGPEWDIPTGFAAFSVAANVLANVERKAGEK
jgi:hypothetical protein